MRLLAAADDRNWRIVDHETGSAEIILGHAGALLPIGEIASLRNLLDTALLAPTGLDITADATCGVFRCRCCDTRTVLLGQTIFRFDGPSLGAFRDLCRSAAAGLVGSAVPRPLAAYPLN